MVAISARLPRRWTFAVAFLLAGAPRFVVLAVPVPFAIVLAVWALSGLACGAINPILGAAEYEAVPRALQARVLAMVGALAWAGIPFGALLAGVLVNATSLTTAPGRRRRALSAGHPRPVRPAGLAADGPSRAAAAAEPGEAVAARPT